MGLDVFLLELVSGESLVVHPIDFGMIFDAGQSVYCGLNWGKKVSSMNLKKKKFLIFT